MAPEDFRYHPRNDWSLLDGDQEFVNEQNLYESSIIEVNDIYGLPILYYVLNFDADKADHIYGEDQDDQFSGPYPTRIMHKPHNEARLVDAFGIINADSLENLNIPMFTFSRDISPNFEPKAGDVMKFIYSGIFYEVTHAFGEEDIFLTKKLSWNLSAKVYRLTNADAEGDNVDIDAATSAFPLSAFGDNIQIEDQANEVDNMADLPNFEDIYGVGD